MQKPLVRTIALIAILALAIAFAGCAKQPQQASPTPKTTPSASPAATLKPNASAAEQDYDYGKYLLHSESLTTAPDGKGVSTDEETISNEGPETAKFSVAEVFPQTKLSDADAAAVRDGETLATRHMVLSPLTQLTDVELGKNERVSFSASSQNKNFAEKTPVRLVTEPDLTAFQRSKLLPVLAKIAELGLGLPQAKAFEETVNKAFAKIKQQQNPFEDYVDAVEEYVDEIHDEIEAAQRAAPPKPTPKIEQIKFPIPTQPKTPTKEDLQQMLPQFPASITFNVTEARPSDVKTFYLKPTTYLGQILYSVNGNAAKYLKASAEQDAAGYLVTVSANVKSAIKNEKIPFDSVSGQIELSFSLLPTEKRSVPVKITVKHVDLAKVEEEPAEDVEELPAPTPTSETNPPETKPSTSEKPTESLNGNCLQDTSRVAGIANRYAESQTPPDECADVTKQGRACACTVSVILKEAGISGIERTDGANDLYNKVLRLGKQVNGQTETPDLSDLREGDLVFSKTYPGNLHLPISHVGIYVGNGQVVEASKSVRNVNLLDEYTGKYSCDIKKYGPSSSRCAKGVCCSDDTAHEGIPKYQGAVRVIPSCLN